MSSDFSKQVRSKRVRAETAAMRFRVAFARLRTKAGFNPNQPRVPAGNPDGGQWTDTGASRGSSATAPAGRRSDPLAATKPNRMLTRVVHDRTGETSWSSYTERRRRSDGKLVSRTVTNRDGSQIVSAAALSGAERNEVTLRDGSQFTFENRGDTQRIIDGKGRLLSEAVWTPTGIERRPVVTPAFVDLNSANKLLEGGATLFNWLSSLKDSGAVAVATFNAAQFLNRGGGKRLEAEWIGTRAAEEIGQICRKFGLVRELADEAAASSPRQLYRSAAIRGTDIHLKVKREIEKFADENFLAELSILKASEARRAEIGNYGLKDTIRIDVFERLGNLVCVYDLKTGKNKLSARRMQEIADNVFSVYPSTQQILVLEVRPAE